MGSADTRGKMDEKLKKKQKLAKKTSFLNAGGMGVNAG